MYKKFPQIIIENLFVVFLILMILPFLLLHFFNNPTPEDFSWGESTRQFGFIQAQRFFYKIWSGRFFSYAVLSVNPLLFKSLAGYKIFSLLLMLLFYYALFLWISEITRSSLSFRERFLISLSIFFLYLYSMPSVSEGFYWLTAVVIYHLGIILILIFFIFYIRLNKTNKLSTRIFYTIISFLTLIAIAGSSEIAAVLILLLLILLIIKNFFVENKFKWLLIFFILLTVIVVFIAFSSPANYLRSGKFSGNHNFLFSINYSSIFFIRKFLTWIFNSPLLVFTLLLIPIFYKIFNDNNSYWFSINPFYSLIAFNVLLFISIFITVWNTGEAPYGRTVNLIYFTFLIGWFFTVIVLLAYFKKKFNWNFKYFPKYVYILMFIIISIFLIKKNNIRTAYSDLWWGTAYRYDNKLKERYNFILQSNSDSCEVDSIKNIPKTFFLLDITGDPNVLYNQWYASYFNKKSIFLKKSDDQKK